MATFKITGALNVMTVYAELKPKKCGDQSASTWHVYAANGRDTRATASDPITLSTTHFPPGTMMVISEPACPCGTPRQPDGQGSFVLDCAECGFNWTGWVDSKYS